MSAEKKVTLKLRVDNERLAKYVKELIPKMDGATDDQVRINLLCGWIASTLSDCITFEVTT